MAKQTLYKHYDLTPAKKQIFSISSFLGVDYSSAQLNVETKHAVDIQNMIFKQGVGNVKRNGWEQIAKANEDEYYAIENGVLNTSKKTNTRNINGVWKFVGEDKQPHIVFHIGNCLYTATGIGKDKTFLDSNLEMLTQDITHNGIVYKATLELLDQKTQAFVGSNRLYILGGNKFYLLRFLSKSFILEEVEESSQTYIPTTTIGITYSWKEKDGEDKPYKVTSVGSRTPLDFVNLLTQWRKNKLVSGTYVESTYSVMASHFWDYELDTSVKPKREEDLKDITVTISSLKEM